MNDRRAKRWRFWGVLLAARLIDERKDTTKWAKKGILTLHNCDRFVEIGQTPGFVLCILHEVDENAKNQWQASGWDP